MVPFPCDTYRVVTIYLLCIGKKILKTTRSSVEGTIVSSTLIISFSEILKLSHFYFFQRTKACEGNFLEFFRIF
jgi:hypothetical protein